MVQDPNQLKRLRSIEALSKLMDSQFRVPGTDIRFGLDSIIGLIPGLGDLSTFTVSGYMVLIMSRNGASGYVLARMILNILVDAIIGAVPIIGDLFDIAFKANNRNFRLMQEHYREGRHKGGAWKVISPVMLLLLGLIVLIVWGVYNLFAFLYHAIF